MLFGSRQRLYLTKANTAITLAREDTDGKQSFVKYFCSTPSFVPLLYYICRVASLDTFHQGE